MTDFVKKSASPETITRLRPEATVRALVVHNESLLLVSNDGGFWYTPGGRIEHGEDAEQAVVREVLEETGLNARILGFSHVEQFFKPAKGLHHINLYFYLGLIDPAQAMALKDPDGQVTMARFFTCDDISCLDANPINLRDGWWRTPTLNNAAWKGTDRA